MITIDKSEIIQSRNELPSEVETLDEAREALQKGEKGKGNTLGEIDADGKYLDKGEAPGEGEELYTLMGQLPWEN